MNSKRSIYNKLITVYILFGILSFLTVSLVSSRLLKNYLMNERVDVLNREVSMLASIYTNESRIRGISNELVYEYLKSVSIYSGCEIWAMDTAGRVIMNTSEEYRDDAPRLEVPEFDPALIRGHVIGDFYGHFDEEMLSVYAPLNIDFRVRGYLVMHYPVSRIFDSNNDILNVTYITVVIVFLLSLLIMVVFTLYVYRPLKKITFATEEYAKGNYEYKLEPSGDDEVGYLAATLGYMASEIARGEDNEKKFIANVSHDFRSPLTSIKGYLEAMIDGTIPPEMHDKYMRIVLNETERLTKLTNSLLQLNNLNVKGILLDIRDFDINPMIKRTCETFEGRCLERGITIELVLTGESMIVSGDETKIQQVIYNLLDNAIKFSFDNSTIKIETTEKNDKLFVSVKDSGVGIPRESIGLVFDRFYKTDPSRGKDKKGTGLGLAITKEIIKAHDENINVISTEGVGTEFIFTIAKSKEREGLI